MLKLHLHKVPAGALDLVSAEFAALPKRTYGQTDLDQVDTDTLEAGVAFRVFEAGIDLDSGEARLERSQPKGTGLLLKAGERIIAAMFLATDSAGKAKHVQYTAFGPFAESFAQALREAEHTIKHGEFEPRLLSVPVLRLNMLWLASRDGSGDHFFRVMPAPKFMVGKHYQAANLVALLKPHLKALIDSGADGEPHEP